jgi:CBS domain-containing protein
MLLNAQILGTAALSLLLAKSIIWSLSLGSGTSGGVLAPLLMMGGAMGALASHLIPVGSPGLWAIVGMAAMMGGTMRSPFTAIIFTLELTYDVMTLPALLIACIASELVTVLWLKRSILTEKVARRGHHLTREYSVDPFEIHRVHEIMEIAFGGSKWFAERRAIPIVDRQNKLKGILTQGDYLRAIEAGDLNQSILDAGSQQLVTVDEDEVVRAAVEKLLGFHIERLMVVNSSKPNEMIGYIDRSTILDAHLRWYKEENHREGALALFVR